MLVNTDAASLQNLRVLKKKKNYIYYPVMFKVDLLSSL